MTTTDQDHAIDLARLEAFAGQVVTDVAAAQAVASNHLGDRLGLYRRLRDAGPQTASELAAATGTNERLVLEWLRTQAVGGYVQHDSADDSFALPAEHAIVLAEPSAPVFMGGAFEVAASIFADLDRLEAAFRGDGGVDWGDHDHRLYEGIRRVFGPLYESSLVGWVEALAGITERLEAGGRIADIGCGAGASTIVLARAFPGAAVRGLDRHSASIDEARRSADAEGLGNIAFEALDATEPVGDGQDLICFLDCLHDMGDPVAAASRARDALADGGAVLVVEPAAGDTLAEAATPVNRMFFSGSTFLCTPGALAQHGPMALGAQAGPAAITDVLRTAGFGTVRVVDKTPFNLVFEARP